MTYSEDDSSMPSSAEALRAAAPGAGAAVDRCSVTFEDGSRCEKDADHRDGRWSDDPHVPGPAAGRQYSQTTDGDAEQRAYDNLYAELTRGVTHAQVRHHLITKYRAAILNSAAEAVVRDAISTIPAAPEHTKGMQRAAALLRRRAAEAGS